MNKRNPFEASACFARVSRTAERLNEVFAALGEIGRAFENTPARKIESAEKVAILFDMLSENLLARALAEEGLALIDQIASETSISKRDPQVAKTPKLQRAVQALESQKESLDARRGELEAFRVSQDQIIETTMRNVRGIQGTLESAAGLLKKEMERRGK